MHNPAAFPTPDPYAGPGMTLRDWFAGQALAGMVPDAITIAGSLSVEQIVHMPEELAAQCYRIADAMLAERVKE